jgi:general secretion pathway protein I
VRSKRGFTLLEVLVATTIMAVAIGAMLSAIGASTNNAARLRDYDRAAQLARLRMNELLSDDLLPRDQALSGTFDPSLTGGVEIDWQARLTNVEMPTAVMTGQPCLQRIELQIRWTTGGGQNRNFTLDSYRTHILKPGDL